MYHANTSFDRAQRLAYRHSERMVLVPYGVAHFGKSLFWYSSELIFAYFLTERVGVPAVWMGGMLGGGLVLSAIIDLVVGWRLGSSSFTLDRARRLQFAGACASAAAITLLFTADLLPGAWRLAWTIFAATAFRIAYALYDIPQNATLSLATRDEGDRARLSALRLFFSGLASIAVATVLAWLVGTETGGSGRYAATTLAMSAMAIGSAWWLVRAPDTLAADRPNDPRVARHSSSDRLGIVSLLWLAAISSAGTSAFIKFEPYYITYHWHGQAGTILIAASMGLALAQPLWLAVIRRAGLVRALYWSIASLGLAVVGFASADAIGYYPQAACALLFGAANGGIGMALWAAFAGAVSDRRDTPAALAFAALTAASKLGLGITSFAISGWLQSVDYRQDSDSLTVAMTLWPVAGMIAALCVLMAARFARTRTHRLQISVIDQGRSERAT